MKIKIITLFPSMFPGCLGGGLIGKSSVEIEIIDITKHKTSKNNHSYIDQKPFGGGEGMIICPSVIANIMNTTPIGRRIYMSPRGKVFNQTIAEELSKEENLIFLCGRYEGVDQRAIDFYNFEEISLGDFILCGGEVAAMTICESIIRLNAGTLSNPESIRNESFYNGLLEYDQYTEHRTWNNISVPDILLTGDHKKINDWKLRNSIQKTKQNRPDLLKIIQTNFMILCVMLIIDSKYESKLLKLERKRYFQKLAQTSRNKC